MQRQQRAPKSSFVRFGKRAPDGLSYSGCVAYTLARARNRSDLLRMLVENGCVKDKRLLHYAKKDGYIRYLFFIMKFTGNGNDYMLLSNVNLIKTCFLYLQVWKINGDV